MEIQELRSIIITPKLTKMEEIIDIGAVKIALEATSFHWFYLDEKTIELDYMSEQGPNAVGMPFVPVFFEIKDNVLTVFSHPWPDMNFVKRNHREGLLLACNEYNIWNREGCSAGLITLGEYTTVIVRRSFNLSYPSKNFFDYFFKHCILDSIKQMIMFYEMINYWEKSSREHPVL